MKTFPWMRFCCCVLLTIGSFLQAAEPPNIVFIYTDDQGAWALGHAGNHQAKTPNLDRLCRQGAYFTNAFVATPVCSPSRAGVMVSRHGIELGITDYIASAKAEVGLDPEIVTWPEVLTAAGYTGGLFGKWHLGALDRFHPLENGFQHFYGFRCGAKLRNPRLEVGWQQTRHEGFLTDLLTDAAIDFMWKNKDRPFFACIHYRAPHEPWLPVADEDWAQFADLDPEIPNPDYPDLDTERIKKDTREYLASVASVDRNVGRLLIFLEKMKLTDKTVVIFSSDNGYNLGHHGVKYKGNAYWILKHKRGTRSNMFDTSLRVPLIVRWPGVVKPGIVVEHTISNLDYYPTILAIAGTELPRGAIIRGRNFLPLFLGKKVPWDNNIYGEYSQRHDTRAELRMYRTPEWKLVRDFKNHGKDELYHLSKDPNETINLIDSNDPEVLRMNKQLDMKLLAAMRELHDPVLKK